MRVTDTYTLQEIVSATCSEEKERKWGEHRLDTRFTYVCDEHDLAK